MEIRNFTAESNPRGSRIDLSWVTPSLAEFPGLRGVRILRSESTHPTTGDTIVLDDTAPVPGATGAFADTGLKENTVYYYSVFAYDQGGNQSTPALASAFATTSYQTGELLYDYLPALYSRFDTVAPPNLAELDQEDRTRGQLRRLTEIFGLQFDLMRSYAAGMRDFSDLYRVDGSLVPLLADWVGWQTDFTLPISKQRNEVRYAPHFHRTTGIAANLRATLNRLTTWDAQVKEFVHNVFMTNSPEQLFIQETERHGSNWPDKPQAGLVTLDVAYEGRPAVVRARDGRLLLFYHTRQSVPKRASGPAPDQWHLWQKTYDQAAWLPARRLTFDSDANKYPAVVETADGNLWVFWASYGTKAGNTTKKIKLQLMSAGRRAHPPRLLGSNVEPFAFTSGSQFSITIDDGAAAVNRLVVLRAEDFRDITKATAYEVAALLNRELPGVYVSTQAGAVAITSETPGSASKLTLPASAVATTLGLAGPASGADASQAQLTGRAGPFNFTATDRLIIRVDNQPPQSIVFGQGQFSVAQTASAINSILPGIAKEEGSKLKLTSPSVGDASYISIDVDASTAAAKLGFGASLPLPVPDSENSEPSAFADNSGDIWLFWNSRPLVSQGAGSTWRLFYNRFQVNAGAWSTAKILTTGPDSEPSVVFDPGSGAAGQGRIWVSWSRKKNNDRWNIFYRTTTKIDFPTLADSDWVEKELTPVPSDYDRKESSPVFTGAGRVEVYFSSNRNDGWHVWFNTLSPNPAADEKPVTSGQFTCRAPVGIVTTDGVRLWFRNNASQVYTSPSYPASQTTDARYAGSTTADTRNATKMGLRSNLQDVLRYTYDTGTDEDDWYARDTVGIYLTPDTDDDKLILRKQSTLANVVRRFLPIQVRAVFIIQQVYPEFVYTYALPNAPQPRFIGEQVTDTILSEIFAAIGESFRDRVNFKFTRTWSTGLPKKGVIDLSVQPPDLSFRLFMRGVEEGA